MGSLNLKLNSSTCSSLLLWSAALLWPLPSPRLRLMLMPSMVLTAMVLVDFMEDMDTLVLAMPDTDMLLLMPMVLTMERGLLTLSLRLMPTMVLTPMPMVPTMARGPLMLSPRLMLMLSMVLMVLAMPMVLTMARGLLMLSPRLMPTMVPMVLVMAMVDFMEDMESVPMVPTPMPMVSMESKMPIPSTNRVAHQVQTEAQKQTFETNLTFSTIS